MDPGPHEIMTMPRASNFAPLEARCRDCDWSSIGSSSAVYFDIEVHQSGTDRGRLNPSPSDEKRST